MSEPLDTPETDLHPEVIAELQGLTAIAHPTSEEFERVLDGWRRYFRMAHLGPPKQLADLKLIMLARVQAGSISCLAPFAEAVR